MLTYIIDSKPQRGLKVDKIKTKDQSTRAVYKTSVKQRFATMNSGYNIKCQLVSKYELSLYIVILVMNANYRIFRPITRALSIQKGPEMVKNEHARYTLERFPTDNTRVFCTKRIRNLKK